MPSGGSRSSGRSQVTILMVARVIAPSGGIESALVDLCRSLIAAGHRVSVYACSPFEPHNQNVDQLRAAGARLSACPTWLARVAATSEPARTAAIDRFLVALTWLYILPALVDARVRRRSVGRSLAGLRGRLRGWMAPWLRLERLAYLPLDARFAARRPDVVHVHGWGYGIDPPGALAWAKSKGLPTVYTEHNSPPEARAGATVPTWLHLADVVIACSQAGARGLSPACRTQTSIAVIPYSVADPTEGISADDYPRRAGSAAPGNRPVTITCLARLSAEHKGQDVLLRAMKILLGRAPTSLLLMAGEGESRPALEALADELDIADAVAFLGHLPRSRLSELMDQSDLMVLPSRWEGLPVSIIESMAFGKPVVASDVGGNPELVVHGVTGLIVPSGDVDALAAALLDLVGDPARRGAMGVAARRRFDEGAFAPAGVAEATLAVYRIAMGERSAPASTARATSRRRSAQP